MGVNTDYLNHEPVDIGRNLNLKCSVLPGSTTILSKSHDSGSLDGEQLLSASLEMLSYHFPDLLWQFFVYKTCNVKQ